MGEDAAPMLLVLLASLSLARAPPAALTVRSALSCPSRAQLQRALAQRAPNLSGTLTLTRAASGAVQVDGQFGGRRFSRQLQVAPNDCASAAETVALLAAAWAGALASPAGSGAPTLGNGEQGTGNGERGTGNGVLAQPAQPPPTMPLAPLESSAPSPIAPLPPAATPWHLALGLEARGALGVGASRRQASGAVAVTVGRGARWALQLDLGLSTPQSARAGPGAVHVQRQTLALRAVARFHPLASHRRLALRLTLGPMLERLAGTSQGYTTSRTAAVYQPGLAAGLAVEGRFGPVALGAGPQVEASFQRAHFDVGGVGEVVTLPWSWAGLALGGRGRFF